MLWISWLGTYLPCFGERKRKITIEFYILACIDVGGAASDGGSEGGRVDLGHAEGGVVEDCYW